MLHFSRAWTVDHAAREIQKRSGLGIKTALVTGCFDVLHAGHIRFLLHIKQHDYAIIVGLNGDRRVRELKGDERPYQPIHDRILCMTQCRLVDGVVEFNEDHPGTLITKLKPTTYWRGIDYIDIELPEMLDIKKAGTELRFYDGPKLSATEIGRGLKSR